MRQVVLDTETTGLETQKGHRIIEVGGVELVNRRPTGRTFHQYINPGREVDAGAIEVHGIDNAFLADKPKFDEIAADLLTFLDGAELVIHNAPFDVGFVDHELRLLDPGDRGIATRCGILDTLTMARERHPGQRNSLDALCKRYDIDNTNRSLHGALLDARILTDVYLAMTGGQVALILADEDDETQDQVSAHTPVAREGLSLRVLPPCDTERRAHEATLARIDEASEQKTLWHERHPS
ncbi:MAG: DNA polymerase III subunit epsilon [Gammaproteobacteria bacterium]